MAITYLTVTEDSNARRREWGQSKGAGLPWTMVHDYRKTRKMQNGLISSLGWDIKRWKRMPWNVTTARAWDVIIAGRVIMMTHLYAQLFLKTQRRIWWEREDWTVESMRRTYKQRPNILIEYGHLSCSEDRSLSLKVKYISDRDKGVS